MARDPRRLRVFAQADSLIDDIYRATTLFPAEERYGLQTQLRRAPISTATNIVEGCVRRTTREYVHFLNIANGSCAEATYLVALARRLGYMPEPLESDLVSRYSALTRALQKLISSLVNQP
jgi:four helix bundle protein